MIRSRSFIPTSSSLSMSFPSNANSMERESFLSRLWCFSRFTPSTGGSKLWRYFCFVMVAGIIVYLMIGQGARIPIRTRPISRLTEKVTVVLNTFKRKAMMQGSINLRSVPTILLKGGCTFFTIPCRVCFLSKQ